MCLNEFNHNRILENLRKAQFLSRLGSWELDITMDMLWLSEEMYDIYPINANKAVTFKELLYLSHPEDLEYVSKKWEAALKGELFDIDYRIVKGDSIYWINQKASITFNERNEAVFAIGIIQDITERKVIEKQKEFFMKELNHRVKNNLALICSLISLKSDELGPQVDLSDLETQVNAIKLVHEKLVKSEDQVYINFREYAADLLSSIFDYTEYRIIIDVNIDIDYIRSKLAIILGLILNEIATNAVKHGFILNKIEKFSVSLTVDNVNKEYIFLISNTGNTFPSKIDFDNTKTLGIQLIKALVDQLKGTISLKRKPFTEFIISVPVNSTLF